MLAPLSEAKIKAMAEESLWAELIYKVDEELQRLESLAQPDETEAGLVSKLEQEPANLDTYYELAEHLISKNRGEEAIPLLLDILAIERNWEQKKAHNKLMEVFKKLG